MHRRVPTPLRRPPASVRRACRSGPRHRLGDRGRRPGCAAASSTSRSGSGSSPVATSTPARRRGTRRCAKRTRRPGSTVEFAGGAPQLVHVDVHPGRRGHTHLDLRYLVEAGDRDPQPARGREPGGRRGSTGTRRWRRRTTRASSRCSAALSAVMWLTAMSGRWGVGRVAERVAHVDHAHEPVAAVRTCTPRGRGASRSAAASTRYVAIPSAVAPSSTICTAAATA